MNKLYLFIAILSYSFSQAQILNAYANITAINGAKTTLTLSNVNETSHTFNVGEKVIIMQMQDDVIGGNTLDDANFGNLGAIANAGVYEIAIISSKTPATGTPTSITITTALAGVYNAGTNSSVQLITFRNMGANYTTTANITGLAWDGNVGGVIALEVTNTLTLNHSINADGIGFRGGSRSGDYGGPVCVTGNTSPYRANNTNQGWKGEGIYKNTNTTYNNARGKILNGGGGGNDHNGGGGGGGNYTSGGRGGNGYNNCTAFPGGGLGGLSLSTSISGTRLFMGGGGGGGQQNNTIGSTGGRGGGIILVRAGTLVTNTICSSAIRISANGVTAANVGNDGAGGGGAAGSIVLNITTFSASATCPLSINSNGGNGGTVTDGAAHAGGGGGGQGAILFTFAQPTVNITSTTNNGIAGADNSGGTISAGNGGGTNNSGIFGSVPNPLPITLLNFNAQTEFTKVKLYWATATEIENDYFTVERSEDGFTFAVVGLVEAVGNSYTNQYYSLYDTKPFPEINYYRLKQTDVDGNYTYSKIISVNFDPKISFSVYPNPATNNESIYLSIDNSNNENTNLVITDVAGKQIRTEVIEGKSTLQMTDWGLAKGVYMISLHQGNRSQTKKLVIY